MVAQEGSPHRTRWQLWRVRQNPVDRRGLTAREGKKNPRHQREMETHVAFRCLFGTEIINDVAGPLVCFSNQHAAGKFLIDHGAHACQIGVRFGKVFTISAVAFVEVGDSI